MKRVTINRSFLFLSLVLLLSLIVIFVSCDKKDETDHRFDELYEAISEYYGDQTETDEQTQNVYVDDEKKFLILIPAGCGAKLYDSAVFLSDTMSKYVGYEVDVKYDSDVKEKSDTAEILIGRTDREKSSDFLKNIRVDEYGYRYDDGALVIGAHTESLCAASVNVLIEKITEKEITLPYINAVKEYIFDVEYDIEQIKINGFDLYEYAIVYPQKEKFSERELAILLKERIAEYSGYSLELMSESELKESTRAIFVGADSDNIKDGYARIVFSEPSDIEILANSNEGLYLAIEKFTELIAEGEKDGICELEINKEKIIEYKHGGESLCFYVLAEPFVGGTLDMYLNAMRGVNKSGIALFDRLSSSVLDQFRINGINPVHLGDNDFYFADTSRMRCVSIERTAVLDGSVISCLMERAEDGKRFAYICAFSEPDGEARDSDGMLDALLSACEEYSEYPTVAVFELSAHLATSFAEARSELAPVEDSKNVRIYYTKKCFVADKSSESKIGEGICADLFRLRFYYT